MKKGERLSSQQHTPHCIMLCLDTFSVELRAPTYIYIQPFNYHLTASLVQWFSIDPLVSAGALQGAILSPESYWYFLWKAGMPCYLPIAKCKLPILNCQLLIANCGMRIAYCHLGIFRTLACASGLPLPTLLDHSLTEDIYSWQQIF